MWKTMDCVNVHMILFLTLIKIFVEKCVHSFFVICFFSTTIRCCFSFFDQFQFLFRFIALQKLFFCFVHRRNVCFRSVRARQTHKKKGDPKTTQFETVGKMKIDVFVIFSVLSIFSVPNRLGSVFSCCNERS